MLEMNPHEHSETVDETTEAEYLTALRRLASYGPTDRLADIPEQFRYPTVLAVMQGAARVPIEQVPEPECRDYLVGSAYNFVLGKLTEAFGYDNFGDAPHLRWGGTEHDTPCFGVEDNVIILPLDTPAVDLVPVFGEEIGHFLRAWHTGRLGQKPNHEKMTDEFFGSLGRSILLRSLTDAERKVAPFAQWLIPDAMQPDQPKGVEGLQKIRGIMAELATTLHAIIGGDPVSVRRIRRLQHDYIGELTDRLPDSDPMRSIDGRSALMTMIHLSERRHSIVVHTRGYDFAAKVDLSRISSLPSLFSLPDKEVRRRFFRPDPQYIES